MRFYNPEDALKQTQQDIESYNEINALLPEIKKVFKAFDGKMYNCKLEKALQEINPRIHAYKRYNSIEIYMYCQNSSGALTICSSAASDSPYHDNTKHFIQDNKRINAAIAFEDIEAHRVKRLQEIASWNEFLKNRETLQQQLEQLKKQIEYLSDQIPWRMKDYFNIGYRVTR